MRSFVCLFVFICFGFRLSDSSPTSTSQSTNKSPSRFELKFQSEPDNSTIIKRELQQQIFKCQVKLAPVNQQQVSSLQNKSSRLKYVITQLKVQQQAQDVQSLFSNTSLNFNNKWQPSNVSIAVDWFKDNQRVDTDFEASLAIINVELKSNSNSNSSAVSRNNNDKTNTNASASTSTSKNGKPRIEIKNTLNGNQLKLTSRLKLNQVRLNDSGHYKCIARASFQLPLGQVDENQNNLYQSNTRPLKAPSERQTLVLIEQALESNDGILLVNNKTLLAGQQEETVMMEREHKKLKITPSNRDPSGKRNLDLFSNTEQPPISLLENASSAIFRLFQQKPQQTNDPRHATTQQEEVNSNTNKGQTGNENEHSSSNVVMSSDQLNSTDLSEVNSRDNVESGSNYPGLLRETKSSKQNQQQQAVASSQFEDDEDLFKLDPDKIELVNSRQTSAAGIDDELFDLNNLRQSRAGRQPSRSLNQENSLFQGDGQSSQNSKDIEERRSIDEKNINVSNNLSSYSMINDKNQTSSGTRHSTFNSDTMSPPDYGNNAGLFIVNNYLGSSLHSTRLQIAEFVHKITPEFSCYTGSGEQYRGNVSITFDMRSCLNWNFVKRNARDKLSLSDISTTTTTQNQARSTFDNHNYCRNPNFDPRGPWCFVHYIDGLDNESNLQNSIVINSKQHQQIAGNFEIRDNQGKFIQRHCPISACSEYLWVYIVAPPLGFLLFLSCLLAIFIRYVRKSYHNKSILFKATKRKGLYKFNKLIQSQASRFAPAKKFANSSSRRKGYLDDDIFEIVDDIDWSDAQTHSSSPKSTESLKLNSSFSSSSNFTDSNSKHLNGCKSINPLFNEKALADSSLIDRKISNQDLITDTNRSVTHIGPMFATLRCQIRNQGNNKKRSNKSSTFIEQCDLATTTTINNDDDNIGCNNKLPPYIDRTNWLADSNFNQPKQQHQQASPSSCVSSSPSSSSSSSSNDVNPTTNSSRPNKRKLTNQASGHLISCSTTSEDIDKSACSEAIDSIYNHRTATSSCNTSCNEKYLRGSDLPQLNASSVAICLDQQPIYEGKFSLVSLAFMKQQIETPSSSSLLSASSSSVLSNNALGHLGTQVAVCSLKSAAVIDPSTFMPSNLKLRNLNHLNILKLIGYMLDEDEIGGNGNNTQSSSIQRSIGSSLVYDMAQLVDLNDWLKQQNKDTLTSDEPGNDLGIRRNLTCFAKQIALAIDYLHDRNIIFKDLACRNCFLDPAKMLVKLASFNIEFIDFNSNDERVQNLKSMIRPKYLLDYYVIDSRPSDCQLLPLSWIPLESILFNKFSKQTDIWSFGCLIYELFSLGEVAYFGYSSKQVIDAVRSNLMPPQPLLCPNGIYKLMCKCLSDIPTIRPTIKQTYEQLNLYSGQCSSFLDHHLCSLATNTFDDNKNCPFSITTSKQLSDLKVQSKLVSSPGAVPCLGSSNNTNSIIKTKSYANIKNFSHASKIDQDLISKYDNLMTSSITSDDTACKPEVGKIPLSRSINLGGNRSENNFSKFKNIANRQFESNHYDEPIVNVKDLSEK